VAVVAASPLLSVMTVTGISVAVAPVVAAAKRTSAPGTALLLLSRTTTRRGVAKAVATTVLCRSPASTLMLAGADATLRSAKLKSLTPLLRITTFVKDPERHDLFLNVGFYTEALHFEVAPRGIEGEESLTLASAQGTLDLWQSEDLRSYVRLRAGPGIEMRFGPWAQETRYVGILPQATLEGNLVMGHRAMQRLNFRLRGELLRSASWHAQELPGNWTAAAEAAYEVIVIAINDQPVSMRFAGSAFLRDDAREVVPGFPSAQVWGWTGTAGIRMAFFSPPVPPAFRK